MADTATIERPGAGESFVTWRLVDADAHIDPPHEMWRDYLPAHLRELAPHVEEGDECDWLVFEGTRKPIRMINNQAGRTAKDFKMAGKRSEQRAVWDPVVRIADMDADGIDAAVLFGGGPLGTFNSELYIASFEAYLRWVWDFCATDRRRLVPIAYLPMRDVDETIGLLRMAAKMGFRSANIPAFPQNPDGFSTSANVGALKSGQTAALTGDPKGARQYLDPEFDRLWAEFEAHDMTVTIHLGARVPRFGDKKHFLADMPMSKVSMIEPIAIMIFNGIFQRFPKLRLASVESGVGWMAWAAEYMDRTWEKQRYWTDSPISEKPSFFMDRQVYASFIQDRTGVLCRDLPGARNILWSSDYPHSETTFPHSRDIIARDFEGIPVADVQDITANRARQLYGVA